MNIRFRVAERHDYTSTRGVVDAAFRPEDVVSFLDLLRSDGCVLGEWLAEDLTGPVGHIVFSRIYVQLITREQVLGQRQPNTSRVPGQMIPHSW
jgi:predicted N-acetyltransferase YhbS